MLGAFRALSVTVVPGLQGKNDEVIRKLRALSWVTQFLSGRVETQACSKSGLLTSPAVLAFSEESPGRGQK